MLMARKARTAAPKTAMLRAETQASSTRENPRWRGRCDGPGDSTFMRLGRVGRVQGRGRTDSCWLMEGGEAGRRAPDGASGLVAAVVG